MGVFLAEFVKLLVAEAFNGHGVNDFFVLSHEIFKREFACESFAAAGVSSDENVVALHDALDGVFLENTQTVWVFFKVLRIGDFIVGGVSVKCADFYHYGCLFWIVR